MSDSAGLAFVPASLELPHLPHRDEQAMLRYLNRTGQDATHNRGDQRSCAGPWRS